MRVLYLHQYFNTPAMSGGTRSYELARRLVDFGHHVTMITSDRDPEAPFLRWRVENVDGIEVHWLGLPYDNRMSYAKRLGSFFGFGILSGLRAARVAADVVYASSTPLTIAVPAWFASRWRRRPMVLEVRDIWPDVPIALGALKNPLAIAAARWLERFAYRSSAAVVALAPGMAQHVRSVPGSPQRVEVIPNGCDIGRFSSRDECAVDPRSAYDWLGERPMLLYAGTLGLVNGVDYLAEVAAAARALDPELRFVVIGDGREREAVERRGAELGVLGVNFFMLPALTKAELVCWLHAATATVSLIEDREYLWQNAVTNKFFDSLAAGRPALSNHPGFQTEVSVEAGCGAQLSASPAVAAEQLATMLRDEQWLASACEAASGLARTRFNRDDHARMLERLLLDQIEGGDRSDSSVGSEGVGNEDAGSEVVGRELIGASATNDADYVPVDTKGRHDG